MDCVDQDINLDGKDCLEAFPTDTDMWCGVCAANAAAAKEVEPSGTTEQ